MYRLGLEGILGLRRVAGGLLIVPCVPPGWPGYEATYRYGATTYHIRVCNSRGSSEVAETTMTIDGRPMQGNLVELHDDGAQHQVEVTL